MSNRFKGQYHRYTKARENLPEKNPSGKKYDSISILISKVNPENEFKRIRLDCDTLWLLICLLRTTEGALRNQQSTGKKNPLKCALLFKCGFVTQKSIWEARVRIPS